jgi:hypothetical protein
VARDKIPAGLLHDGVAQVMVYAMRAAFLGEAENAA